MSRGLSIPALAACGAAALAGCVDAGPSRSGPGRQPSDAVPSTLFLGAPNFADTDDNGYCDTAQVVVYAFDPQRYQLALDVQGSFRFELVARQGGHLAAWEFSEAQAAGARRRLSPGPGFVFTLSLLDHGSDQLEVSEADLVCEFTPRSGAPISARSSPLQIGKVPADRPRAR